MRWGLAELVGGWVVGTCTPAGAAPTWKEADVHAPASTSDRGRVAVERCRGGVIVGGEKGERIVLLGGGRESGRRRVGVERGAVIEIRRGLAWEIHLDNYGDREMERGRVGDDEGQGETWLVAGDWRVASGP